MTTKQTISKWFDDGVADRQMFMFVMCDTYDWEDYPRYARTVEDARMVYIQYPSDMQKIMEVYDLRKDKQEQLKSTTSWAKIE